MCSHYISATSWTTQTCWLASGEWTACHPSLGITAFFDNWIEAPILHKEQTLRQVGSSSALPDGQHQKPKGHIWNCLLGQWRYAIWQSQIYWVIWSVRLYISQPALFFLTAHRGPGGFCWTTHQDSIFPAAKAPLIDEDFPRWTWHIWATFFITKCADCDW